jgi:hypothetical protein
MISAVTTATAREAQKQDVRTIRLHTGQIFTRDRWARAAIFAIEE